MTCYEMFFHGIEMKEEMNIIWKTTIKQYTQSFVWSLKIRKLKNKKVVDLAW